ncbi:MAG: hypothetical protein M3317_03750 [Actinomycetota bacterium]|nr:hypothetical protein [Actinomycetota bacterium]
MTTVAEPAHERGLRRELRFFFTGQGTHFGFHLTLSHNFRRCVLKKFACTEF